MNSNNLSKVEHEYLTTAILSLYFLLSIFEPYLNGILGGSYLKFYIIIMLVYLLYRNSFKIELNAETLYFIAWMLYRTISLIWSQDYTTARSHYMSLLLSIICVCVFTSSHLKKEIIDICVNIYWLTSGVLGLLSLFFSSSYLGTISSRQVLTLFGAQADPNNQAALLIIGIIISMYKMFWDSPTLMSKILSVVILIMNLYAVFLTASRAGLVTILVLFLACLFLQAKDDKRFYLLLARVLFIGVILYLLYYLASRYLSTDVFSRLFDTSSYEGGSGRTEMWANGWKLFTNDLLTVIFGTGWGTSLLNTGTSTGLHNTFLIMLCDVGVLGTLLFFIPIVKKLAVCSKNGDFLPVILFIAMFIPSFFIDAMNKRFLWNAILILFMYASNSSEPCEENVDDNMIICL